MKTQKEKDIQHLISESEKIKAKIAKHETTIHEKKEAIKALTKELEDINYKLQNPYHFNKLL